MLDPDVHPLLDVTVANDLVDNDTDSTRCYIVDNAGSTVIACNLHVWYETRSQDEPMIVLVWHTLLLGSVGLDVDNVTNPEVDEVRRKFNETLLCKSEVGQKIPKGFDETTNA